MEDRCIMCGEVIPEGTQVCKNCEEKIEDKEIKNLKYKVGDKVKWFLNPKEYISGVVVEVCGDETVWVEHSNGQQRRYRESELELEDRI